MAFYEGIEGETVAALGMSAAQVRANAPCPFTVHDDTKALRDAMAERLLADIAATLDSGREHCTMIVPVGPVGQYDILADVCARENRSLARVTLVVMDEYLDLEGNWISQDDPLSFRGHMRDHLLARLPQALQPEIIVPDPSDLGAIPALITARGGLDFTYAGVGITGHLAFNDPVPGRTDPDWFAGLQTRVVSLAPETRLINSVTAARGNVDRIPSLAVTVGMKEILGAKKLRVFMNRHWQSAALRKMLFGPLTAAFPASLVQRHPDMTLEVTQEVLDVPEPGLR